MKWLILMTLSLAMSFQVEGKAKKTKGHLNQKAQATSKKLEKNISFSDRLVNGKHQVPGEGLVTVENEKPVFNLITIRSNFSDRREKERQRD
jgi:hypothetical protein